MIQRYCYIFCLVVFIGACSNSGKKNEPAPSQTPTVPALVLTGDSAMYYFEGTIGDKTPIAANIVLNRDTLEGTYFYYSQAQDLRLGGKIQADGSFWMKEYPPENDVRDYEAPQEPFKSTGEFRGKLDRTQGQLKGQWVSADGKRTLDFSLQATAQYDCLKHKTLEVHCNFPVFNHANFKALNDTLLQANRKGYDTMVVNVTTMRNEALADRADQIAKGDTEYVMSDFLINGFSEMVDSEIQYSSPQVVSLRELSSSFSGGAHGIYGFSGETFEIKNGVPVRIRLRDIFQPNSPYAQYLSEAVRKDLKRQKASFLDDITVADFTKRFQEEDGATFTVRPFGLTFYFNPYDVGSYAEGAFQVHVSWNSLKQYVKPDGISRYFVK